MIKRTGDLRWREKKTTDEDVLSCASKACPAVDKKSERWWILCVFSPSKKLSIFLLFLFISLSFFMKNRLDDDDERKSLLFWRVQLSEVTGTKIIVLGLGFDTLMKSLFRALFTVTFTVRIVCCKLTWSFCNFKSRSLVLLMLLQTFCNAAVKGIDFYEYSDVTHSFDY